MVLGNTALLNHETDLERQNEYSELITGYKWYEKTHLYSALATTMLSHNSLKRSLYSSSNKRRIVTPSAHIGTKNGFFFHYLRYNFVFISI
jgi:hypothetical protein